MMHGQEAAESGWIASVRAAVDADLMAVARLAAERNQSPVAQEQMRYERVLQRSRSTAEVCFLVAEIEGEVVAYAAAGYHPGDETGQQGRAPAGWYLTGIVVAPAHRRRGIGEHLTRARLKWVAQRAQQIYYFANARNVASIALHARLGFVEITRDFEYPGVTFEGGEGILFRAELNHEKEHA